MRRQHVENLTKRNNAASQIEQVVSRSSSILILSETHVLEASLKSFGIF